MDKTKLIWPSVAVVCLAFAYWNGKESQRYADDSRARDSVAVALQKGRAYRDSIRQAREDSIVRADRQLQRANTILRTRSVALGATADSLAARFDSVIATLPASVRQPLDDALKAAQAVAANCTAIVLNDSVIIGNQAAIIRADSIALAQDKVDFANEEKLRQEAEKSNRPSLFRRVRDAVPLAAVIVVVTDILTKRL